MSETDAGSPKEIEKNKPTFLDKIRGCERFIYTGLALTSLAGFFVIRSLDLPPNIKDISRAFFIGAGLNFAIKDLGASNGKSLIFSASLIAILEAMNKTSNEHFLAGSAGVAFAGATNELLARFFEKPEPPKPDSNSVWDRRKP